MIANIGDWIRFERGGRLVIGTVAYVSQRLPTVPTTLYYMTEEYGAVASNSVLEVRSSEFRTLREARNVSQHP